MRIIVKALHEIVLEKKKHKVKCEKDVNQQRNPKIT